MRGEAATNWRVGVHAVPSLDGLSASHALSASRASADRDRSFCVATAFNSATSVVGSRRLIMSSRCVVLIALLYHTV